MKITFVMNAADTEPLLEKLSSCDNNPTKLFTSKKKPTYVVWLFIIRSMFV